MIGLLILRTAPPKMHARWALLPHAGKEPVLNLNTNHQSTAWSLSKSGVGALPANPVELERAANAARATNRIAERILMERTIASFACVHPKLSEVIFRVVKP